MVSQKLISLWRQLRRANYDEFRPKFMTSFGQHLWRDELNKWRDENWRKLHRLERAYSSSEVGVSRLISRLVSRPNLTSFLRVGGDSATPLMSATSRPGLSFVLEGPIVKAFPAYQLTIRQTCLGELHELSDDRRSSHFGILALFTADALKLPALLVFLSHHSWCRLRHG